MLAAETPRNVFAQFHSRLSAEVPAAIVFDLPAHALPPDATVALSISVHTTAGAPHPAAPVVHQAGAVQIDATFQRDGGNGGS